MNSPHEQFDWMKWLTPVCQNIELKPNEPVFVYGAGTVGRDVVAILQSLGHKILGVLDEKMPRRELAGIPVQHPDRNEINRHTRQTRPVVLAVFNCFVDAPAIRNSLKTYGWTHAIDFLDFHAANAKALGDRYWLTDRNYYREHASQIAAADKLWHDDQSRQLFRNILRFRVTGDDSLPPPPNATLQYFPRDLSPWETPLRMVDCGACTGDTLHAMRAQQISIESVALFEPDMANFAQLAREAASLSETGASALAWPCGVAAETGLLRFQSSLGTASALSDTGDMIVPCVSLDDVLHGFHPNFIKMDIEGAEAGALCGARRLIAQERPWLAICVYHRPDDLWKIALQIAEWDLRYNMHLKMYQYRGFDTVLYAIPA